MNVTPLALHSTRGVRDALRGHGWEDGAGGDAAGGIHPLALHLTGLDQDALEALVPFAGASASRSSPATTGPSLPAADPASAPSRAPGPCPSRSPRPPPGRPGACPPSRRAAWHTARGPIPLDDPVLDRHPQRHSRQLQRRRPLCRSRRGAGPRRGAAAEGATIVDVGGESTRPGRDAECPAREELAGSFPVIDALVRAHPELPISIDTVKSEVARAALDAWRRHRERCLRACGSIPRWPRSPRPGAGVVLMHSRGSILELASYRHATTPAGWSARSWPSFGRPWRRAAAAGSPPSGSCSTRASASPRRGAERRAVRSAGGARGARPAGAGRPVPQAVPRRRSPALRSISATGRRRWPARWPGSGARGSSGSMPSRRRGKLWP